MQEGKQLVSIRLVVWVADPDKAGADDGLVFKEELSVLNATHLAALLEGRLRARGIHMAVGACEYYDGDIGRWMPLVAEHDIERFEQPIKLKLTGRKRSLVCRVHPLRATADNAIPRRIAVYAATLDDLRTALKAQLPPEDQGFHDVLLCDPQTLGWALLEDLSSVPRSVEHLDLKLVPLQHSVPHRELLERPRIPAPADLSDPNVRLRHVVALESARYADDAAAAALPSHTGPPAPEARPYKSIPSVATSYRGRVVDMPVRIAATPMAHTLAEIRQLHDADIPPADPSLLALRDTQHHEDQNRHGCCYPGSGQVYSVDSSDHGRLKRDVISYCRMLLEDPHSPVQEFLPPGGLPTSTLVNLTALTAHYFMIKSVVRPGSDLGPSDRSLIHSIIAECINDLPYVQQKRADDERRKEAADNFYNAAQGNRLWPDAGLNDSAPPPSSNPAAPQVVLMRPRVDAESTIVVYGTVTCAYPVECKWTLKTRSGAGINVDSIFDRGLAVTEPVSSSSFALKLLPGMFSSLLVPVLILCLIYIWCCDAPSHCPLVTGSIPHGHSYGLTLRAISEHDGSQSAASQEFEFP